MVLMAHNPTHVTHVTTTNREDKRIMEKGKRRERVVFVEKKEKTLKLLAGNY